MIYLWNMAMWRITWGYIPVVWFPIDLPFISHMALYNSRTSHRGFWLAKPTMGDFPDLEYQRVAVFRSFLLGSAVPVFTQWILYMSPEFFGGYIQWKKYISPFFHLSNVTTYHRGYITSTFHFNKKWRYLHHSFTISFFRGFGSKSHFTSQPFSIFHLRYPAW